MTKSPNITLSRIKTVTQPKYTIQYLKPKRVTVTTGLQIKVSGGTAHRSAVRDKRLRKPSQLNNKTPLVTLKTRMTFVGYGLSRRLQQLNSTLLYYCCYVCNRGQLAVCLSATFLHTTMRLYQQLVAKYTVIYSQKDTIRP